MSTQNRQTNRDRHLGDEWLDWDGAGGAGSTRAGKRTFLILSLAVLCIFLAAAFLFWYLVLPRFALYGEPYVIFFTTAMAAGALFFIAWYILLTIAVFSRNNYLKVCLQRGTNLFIALFPVVTRLARSLGISRDRLSHSFIQVTNRLAGVQACDGVVLALLPRCLRREIKLEIRNLCAAFPNVQLHTAPGGNEARRIIHDVKPSAIIAVACERDLVSGIQDVAPRIPVIGIANNRPAGPCKDTSIDLEEFRAALARFCLKA